MVVTKGSNSTKRDSTQIVFGLMCFCFVDEILGVILFVCTKLLDLLYTCTRELHMVFQVT